MFMQGGQFSLPFYLFISMLLSLLLAAASLAADTVSVDHALLYGPYPVAMPYATDSLNMGGKPYEVKTALEVNAALATAPLEGGGRIGSGEPVPGAQRGVSLSVSRFTVQTSRFVEAEVSVPHIKDYRLFVDETECKDKRLTLAPGRVEVSILSLSSSEKADTFAVSLTGDDLRGLQVNAGGLRPYTMADMMLGPHYYRVRLSPSGKYLVTVGYELKSDGKADYATSLIVVDTGEEIMRLAGAQDFRWLDSPDDLLYYTRSGAKGRELVACLPDRRQTRVLASAIPEGDFTLSPDRSYLIYSKTDECAAGEGGVQQLLQPDDRQPGWRNRSSLWKYDLHTHLMERLTYGKAGVGLADISADGRKVLVQYGRTDLTRSPFSRSTWVELDMQTGEADTLLCDTAYVASACYSPDARQLLLSASPAAFDGVGSEVRPGQTPNMFDNRLYLYTLSSRSVKPLLRSFAPSVEQYEWHEADGMVYFVACDGADRRLFRLDPRSERVVRYDLPVTYVQGVSIARGRAPRAVYFGQTGERAREMFVSRLSDKADATRRIGSIDFDDLYKGVAVGKVSDWEFCTSRGDTVKGFYILPPDFSPEAKYPLLVYYYGGCMPTGKTLEFQYPLQVLAGQGYVVYVCQPSGAIGYGQEFAARHVNAWGKLAADDIIEGTQAFMRSHAFVDSLHVGCMGASYGGFMTQYLQTRTHLFAAAVSHAGISNIASYWGGGYWGYSYGECAQFGSYPWNNPRLYVEQSPLFHADKITTPLLLLHGTADTNVPTDESQQLFTALKILGREVSYFRIDGQNHVITDYAKRLRWQSLIFAWFAKYLKGDEAWWNYCTKNT